MENKHTNLIIWNNYIWFWIIAFQKVNTELLLKKIDVRCYFSWLKLAHKLNKTDMQELNFFKPNLSSPAQTISKKEICRVHLPPFTKEIDIFLFFYYWNIINNDYKIYH